MRGGRALPLPSIEVERLAHRYGDRDALRGVSFSVGEGEAVALLGPNGGGKTTLLKILATLLVATSGTARVAGEDVRERPERARAALGVVFQSPGLDKKLSVLENLRYQSKLYGIPRSKRAARIESALQATGVGDRRRDRVERLSGGFARRVDLARAFLSRPRVLLLDEPTVGLDPAARREFWDAAARLRGDVGATLLYTTHLTSEADSADRVGLVHEGRLEAFDTPAALTASIGGDVITVRAEEAAEPENLAREISAMMGREARAVDGAVVFEDPKGPEAVARVAGAFPGLRSVSMSRPTLEDVFLRLTGTAIDRGVEA